MDTTNPTVHAVHRDVVIFARENASAGLGQSQLGAVELVAFPLPSKGCRIAEERMSRRHKVSEHGEQQIANRFCPQDSDNLHLAGLVNQLQ